MSDQDSDGFDWVETGDDDSDTGDSDTWESDDAPEHDFRKAIEELREENARLKQEKEDVRQEDARFPEERDSTSSEQAELEEEDALEWETQTADTSEEVQQEILEMHRMLSDEYEHGVPRKMLIGTVEEYCDATDENVDSALQDLMNVEDLVENQQLIYRPEQLEQD